MRMTAKLRRNANTVGPKCPSADHKVAVLEATSGSGDRISMINNVSAIAKTPSQKASRRVFDVIGVLVIGRGECVFDPCTYFARSAASCARSVIRVSCGLVE